MEDKQVEHVSMLIKVKTFLNKKTTELAATPVVASTLRPALLAKITEILEEEEDATAPIGGTTELKRQLRISVEEKGFTVAAACAAYYTITVPNPKLRVKCEYERSNLSETKMKPNDLFVKMKLLHEIADPIKALLAPFGVTAADVDDLDTALDELLVEIQGPKDAIGERSASIKQVERLIVQAMALLTDQLDVVMKYYLTNNTELHDYYLRARSIDQTGGGPIPDEDEELTIGVGEYIPGSYPAEFSASTRIGISAKGTNTQDLIVGFSNSANNFSGISMSLSPGGELDKTAAELGYNPGIAFFYIHNPSTPGAIASMCRTRVYF